MASIIWDRDPQEAMNNPYEYNAQKQFDREAMSFVKNVSDLLLTKKKFTLDDHSLEKAVWMLQTDALFSFKDCVSLLIQKRHRIVGRLLRDILETIHLVEYLSSDCSKAKVKLSDWYNDEPLMHREYRQFVKQRFGESEEYLKKQQHRIFSKFTHRTYKSLLYGYILGGERRIVYDDAYPLVPTIAMYYAFVGTFGLFILENLKQYSIISPIEIDKAWNDSMEEFQIPRGYLSEEDKKFLGITDESAENFETVITVNPTSDGSV